MKKIKIGALVLLLGGVFAFNVSVLTDNLDASDISLDYFFSQAQAIDSEVGDLRNNYRQVYEGLPIGIECCRQTILRKCPAYLPIC